MSRYLSFVLRHDPQSIGVKLDPQGWVNIDTLLAAIATHRTPGKKEPRFDREVLEQIVAEDEKGRYTIKDNRIRANQGHSTAVDLALEPWEPPDHLWHGTARKWLKAIFAEGLQKGKRHHVHLSADFTTAVQVGNRRKDQTVILKVDSGAMHRDGHLFYQSENGVWLTDQVPPRYLTVVCPPADTTDAQ